MPNKNIIRIALITGLILLIPLLAMQFTDEVNWTAFDFVVASILLFGTGLAYELMTMRANNATHRAAIGVAVATALFLIWSNLAVGLIGNENNSANLMYIGVLAVGIIGALIVRFQPQKMTYVLFATALAQISVAIIALVAGMHQYPGISVSEILGVNGLFVLLWLISALLFRNATFKK